jgi:hypothetical protein
MFCCFYQKNINLILINKQKKEEYKNIKTHISIIGNHKPMSVYHGNKNIFNSDDIILGLNSLCQNEIHISIGFNPNRLILSHIAINNENIKYKDECFHIMKFENKNINNIYDITQYDIYNAIQEYIFINKKEPKYNIKEQIIIAT